MPASFTILVLTVILGLALAAGDALKQFKISDVTVSGFSSGGYMAVQMHVAYSSIVNGSAVFAGGPFYCAEGTLAYAENKCMKTTMGLPSINTLVGLTNSDAVAGYIDRPNNMLDDRVYLFSGQLDSVVDPKVVDSLQSYYSAYVRTYNIVADYAVEAEHVFPTVNYGNACESLVAPFIGKCGFDGAGQAFGTLFPNQLKPRTQMVAENFLTFDQTPYFKDKKASIADQGFLYVPTACQQGATCRLHVAFHACEQDAATAGNQFASNNGFNEWAESNNIIVLYPYVKKSEANPTNPKGCWDWWGYTNAFYGVKDGVQMKFVRAVIAAISGL